MGQGKKNRKLKRLRARKQRNVLEKRRYYNEHDNYVICKFDNEECPFSDHTCPRSIVKLKWFATPDLENVHGDERLYWMGYNPMKGCLTIVIALVVLGICSLFYYL